MREQALNEADASKVDYVLKLGLARDQRKLNYYRRVIADPKRSVNDSTLRPYAGEMLATLLDIVFNDAIIWNRFKTVLTKRKQSVRSLREEISDSGLRSLIEKSMETEVPLEVVLEVYSRGAVIDGEREGFGRVNSFLAGGKARELDADLLGERRVETKQNSDALAVIKRVLKEKRSD